MPRKRVFIAGLLSDMDKLDNYGKAVLFYRILLQKGFAPICPQLQCMPIDILGDNTSCEYYEASLEWIKVSDALVLLPGDKKYTYWERKCAEEHSIPIYTNLGRLLEETESGNVAAGTA